MRTASPTPFILSPVAHAVLMLACAAAWVLPASQVRAQTLQPSGASADQPVGSGLKSTPMLSETVPEGPGNELPTFVFGERITGRTDLETVIDGNAELRRGATSLKSDRLQYDQPTDTVRTTGNVRINNKGDRFEGPELELKLDTFQGFFTSPTYRFLAGGNGNASRIDFIDSQRLTAHQATYTTCQRDDEASWRPAWQMTAERVTFDFEEESGTATGPTLRFKDVPLLYWPGTVSFPLSDKRKSGFLPPTLSIDTVSGQSATVPYYLNIAPNRDATLSPTFMSKRGVDLAGEFRYLEPNYKGELRANVLPGDDLRNRNRWSYGLLHSGIVNSGVPAIGNLGLSLNLNRVSDDDYWRDFPNDSTTSLTQRLISSDASLTWGRGYFSSALRTLKWQTLQDPEAPIVPPYDRLPQLTARYARVNVPVAVLGGIDWSIEGDYTSFRSAEELTLQPNGQRAFTRAQVSRPWLWPAGFITPRLQLHATSYQFETPLANGARSATRVLPTFSLDSGLQFERNASYFGRNFTQTLEPRAFYVRTPYRDQSLLPNYDVGLSDFNFATVYTENPYVGNDRIADANLLTLGVTSRLLDPATGAEAVRVGIAQRIRFEDQRVTLPGQPPVTDRLSDVLLGATVNWSPKWTLDASAQYNPKLGQSERTTIGARYNPSNYRVVSAAFRRQRGLSQQIDVGWQWPINDLWGDKGLDLGPGQGQGPGRWYSVGRLNYSVPDKRLVEALVGVEYDGCCWIGRVVLQRSQSGVRESNTKILFQLEFVGFSRIGNNPLTSLRNSIPRYQNLREQVITPSRFTTYD
jgi:LPS-assembly protein